MNNIWQKLEDPDKKYRPHPLWSWNDELEEDLCHFEIDEMEKAGIGGFFMHARTGLKTEYLSEKWMRITKVCMEHATEKGLIPWGYDEDGWPSGFAGGKVQTECPESVIQWLEVVPYEKYTGKELVLDRFRLTRDEDLGEEDWFLILCENKDYVDLLNPKTTETFIKQTHQVYKDTLTEEEQKRLAGFFTDEPQYRREKIPYSSVLEEAFKKKYKQEMTGQLAKLFFDIEGAKTFRYQYYNLVSELFVQNFTKQLYNWLEKNNLGFTGHFIHEESLLAQMEGTAGVMPHYEYMSMPGMDWLGRGIRTPMIPRQVSSVAAQTGKEQVLSETFALCGWNMNFEELKWIAHWQIVNGVTLICQHLQGFTLRGSRKRDYPPSLFYQQPYWEEYKKINDYFGRLGQLLSNAKSIDDVCLIHPIRSAWMIYKGENNEKLEQLNADFEQAGLTLAGQHLPFHYVDEGMMERIGSVTEDGKLQVGECTYSNVVLPSMYNMDLSTLLVLEKFASRGGKILSLGQLPTYLDGVPNVEIKGRIAAISEKASAEDIKEKVAKNANRDISIADCKGQEIDDIHVMSKEQDGKTIYFVTNLSTENDWNARVRIKNVDHVEVWDLWEYTSKSVETLAEQGGREFLITLPAKDAIVFVCDVAKKELSMDGELKIEAMDLNAITLDLAQYRIDDGEWQPEKAVIRIMKELLEGQKNREITLKFSCDIDVPVEKLGEINLVLESPEKYNIVINDKKFEFKDEGFWKDSSFRKANVSAYLKQGTNEILLFGSFYQREKVYQVLFGDEVMETELNKLTYDTELESIYLCGDFGVYNRAKTSDIERDAYVTSGDFYIAEAPTTLVSGDFSKQGLQFYPGNIQVSKEYDVVDLNENYVLRFEEKPKCASLNILVNGVFVRNYCGGSLETDVTKYLQVGKNKIELQFIGTNRNLMGPHHFVGGESFSVGPDTFGETGGWTEPAELQGENIWVDTYCFVKFGL